MEKFKAFVKSKKAKVGLAMTALCASLMSFASAAEAEGAASVDVSAIKSSFTTGVSGMVTTTVDVLSAILPFALSIVSVYFVVKKGMAWIKKI